MNQTDLRHYEFVTHSSVHSIAINIQNPCTKSTWNIYSNCEEINLCTIPDMLTCKKDAISMSHTSVILQDSEVSKSLESKEPTTGR